MTHGMASHRLPHISTGNLSNIYKHEQFTMARKGSLSSLKLPRSLNKFVTNTYVLYAIAILAVVNIVGYIMMGDYGSMVFFILSAVLATYFTKNMGLTLLTAILMTNVIYRWMRSSGFLRSIEGFDSKDGKDSKDAKNGKPKNGSSAPKPASNEDDDDDEVDNAERVDQGKTMKEAYAHLDKFIGKDGIKGLSKEAMTLANEQKQLLETMKTMEPIMKTMTSTLDQFGGMESLVSMANKLGGTKF